MQQGNTLWIFQRNHLVHRNEYSTSIRKDDKNCEWIDCDWIIGKYRLYPALSTQTLDKLSVWARIAQCLRCAAPILLPSSPYPGTNNFIAKTQCKHCRFLEISTRDALQQAWTNETVSVLRRFTWWLQTGAIVPDHTIDQHHLNHF